MKKERDSAGNEKNEVLFTLLTLGVPFAIILQDVYTGTDRYIVIMESTYLNNPMKGFESRKRGGFRYHTMTRNEVDTFRKMKYYGAFNRFSLGESEAFELKALPFRSEFRQRKPTKNLRLKD